MPIRFLGNQWNAFAVCAKAQLCFVFIIFTNYKLQYFNSESENTESDTEPKWNTLLLYWEM